MQLGMIGLGRMGGNIVRRLMRNGHTAVVYDKDAKAVAALAAEGCARRPVEKILPYSKAPEHVLPGTTTYYASVIPSRGDAIGVLVESHEGRPTKIEGNPDHPSSGGATDLFAQGATFHARHDFIVPVGVGPMAPSAPGCFALRMTGWWTTTGAPLSARPSRCSTPWPRTCPAQKPRPSRSWKRSTCFA